MFTGIIQSVGAIAELQRKGADTRARIATGGLDLSSIRVGDSIAVSGVCLTVTEHDAKSFAVDISAETLRCTTFSSLAAGARVNLEPALAAGAPLGGHFVTGHVDGVGRVLDCRPEGASRRVSIEVPHALAKYIAAKGSLCVDGVSLTVNEINGNACTVNLIPHTLQHTTLGALAAGAQVNLEVDIIARYLERLHACR
ncbi:MAG: riboflavin synthase [Gammaproteobacteria bacterium]|nr:MAG: riboflavin synthase [Gammaproteobacteria bacterium]